MEQNFLWDKTQLQMKFSNNLAAHDSLLTPLKEELSNGLIIFDPVIARNTYQETLSRNLGLDPVTLEPVVGSPLRHQVEIIDFIIIDDSNTATFPFLYQNATYGLTKWLNGPAIFAVIRSDPPHLINRFNRSPINPIVIPSIEEYKMDKL
jgi:hypothetical protein